MTSAILSKQGAIIRDSGLDGTASATKGVSQQPQLKLASQHDLFARGRAEMRAWKAVYMDSMSLPIDSGGSIPAERPGCVHSVLQARGLTYLRLQKLYQHHGIPFCDMDFPFSFMDKELQRTPRLSTEQHMVWIGSSDLLSRLWSPKDVLDQGINTLSLMECLLHAFQILVNVYRPRKTSLADWRFDRHSIDDHHLVGCGTPILCAGSIRANGSSVTFGWNHGLCSFEISPCREKASAGTVLPVFS